MEKVLTWFYNRWIILFGESKQLIDKEGNRLISKDGYVLCDNGHIIKGEQDG